MFPSIALTKKYDPNGLTRDALDIGLLAETMLYYDSVTVIADHQVWRDLVNRVTPSVLRECMECGYLRVQYLQSRAGIHTKNADSPFARHSVVFIQAPKYQWSEYGPRAISSAMGCSTKGGKRFLRHINDFVDSTFLSDDLRIGTLEDFSNGQYVEEAAAALVSELVPTFERPRDFRFRIHREGDTFVIDTNIDFETLNATHHLTVSPKHSSVTPGILLAHLLDVRQDWFFSSQLESEVTTDSVRSVIYKLKFQELISRRSASGEQIEIFQDTVFSDSKAISEAINSGERTFPEFWRVLSKGSRFKEWLRGKERDQSLLREYVQEVTSDSWIDSLPAKGVRWSVFTGLGLLADLTTSPVVGKAIGSLLSGSDTFLVDKLVKGWKPNQFINKIGREFVQRPNPLTILPRSAK